MTPVRGGAAGPQRRRADRRPRSRLRRRVLRGYRARAARLRRPAARRALVGPTSSRVEPGSSDSSSISMPSTAPTPSTSRAPNAFASGPATMNPIGHERERPHPVVSAHAPERVRGDVVGERGLPPDHQQREAEPVGERDHDDERKWRAQREHQALERPHEHQHQPDVAAGGAGASGCRSASRSRRRRRRRPRATRTRRCCRTRRARPPARARTTTRRHSITAPVNTAIVTHTHGLELTSPKPARSSSSTEAVAPRACLPRPRADPHQQQPRSARTLPRRTRTPRRRRRRARAPSRAPGPSRNARLAVDSVSARASWIIDSGTVCGSRPV